MMTRQQNMWLQLTLSSLFVFVLSGCTLKASTESLTDATTNFTSSTTPGAWFTQDGLLQPDEKINMFVAMNQENLYQDMAQGDGEYLTALGILLEYSDKELPKFKSFAQDAIQTLLRKESMSIENLPARLSSINTKATTSASSP